MTFGNVEQNVDEDLIKSEERDRLLRLIDKHLMIAQDQYRRGSERDAGKWMSCNSTDHPCGKVDALEQLRKEFMKKGKI